MREAFIWSRGEEIINDRLANAVIGVAFFVIATALGAYVRIPLRGNPVPITLQTFFALLSGAVLGRRLGVFSQVGYIMAGLVGIPVFQNLSFGIPHLLGPTGGYIIGFALAAYLVGQFIGEGTPSKGRLFATFAVGDLVIHLLGFLWLTYLYKMSPATAISLGVLPFLPGETLKILAATAVYSRIWRRSREIFPL
jgi:biotin transport system substrate-specific component